MVMLFRISVWQSINSKQETVCCASPPGGLIHNNELQFYIFFQCDVGNEDEVDKMFQWIENNPSLGRVDICIPNAGFSTDATLMEGN